VPNFDSEKDYYRVLGVADGASAEEIERAFRREARKHHPDSGGSEEEMKSLNEAHDVLSDPAIRNAYDEGRKPPERAYGSSMALDPEPAASGTLKIPVSDEDLAGLTMGAATCIGLGLPLLALVEMQWVFFLWPLRLMALGALGLGAIMAHSALSAKHRQLKRVQGALPTHTVLLHRAIYWIVALGGLALIVAFYASLMQRRR
jgi:hypothetical protein